MPSQSALPTWTVPSIRVMVRVRATIIERFRKIEIIVEFKNFLIPQILIEIFKYFAGRFFLIFAILLENSSKSP